MFMSSSGTSPGANERIDSWKAIAAFFGRDERTVKRWEKERSLPVHRVPGERGGVFAYTHELNRWLNRTHGKATVAEFPAPGPRLAESAPVPAPARPPSEAAEPHRAGMVTPSRPLTPWVAILAAAAVAVLGFWGIEHLRHRTHQLPAAGAAQPSPVAASHNPEAENLYLRGRYYWNRRTSSDLNQAVGEFTQALADDPGYGAAYAGLAETYDLMPEYGAMTQGEAYPRAIAAAQKALALDDSLAEAHAALAFATFYWDWNVNRAFAEYQRAIQLDPRNVNALHWYASSLLPLGRYVEASTEIERARELDPTSRSILADQAQIGLSTGDRQKSIATLRELERTEPDFLSAPRYLASYFFEQRDYRNYIAEAERAATISNNPDERAVATAARDGWARGGERGLLDAVRAAEKKIFYRGGSSGYMLALTCARLGRNAEAVDALQGGFRTRDVMLLVVFASDAYSGSELNTHLRGNPDFEQLRNQVLALVSGHG